MKSVLSLVILFVTLWPIPSFASGKIGYGSRAGMEVTVVSVTGLNTPHAVVKTKHTMEDAKAYCRYYMQKVTAACVQQELKIPINDSIIANCQNGEFRDFFGNKYRFEGQAKTNQNISAKFIIRAIPNNLVADGSSASGYGVNMGIFRALCPTRAPSENEE